MTEKFKGLNDDVIQTIGNTPLIRLNKVVQGTPIPIFGKAEFFNPGGSIKDRIGGAIIEAAEKTGELKPGGVIVEGTSGNTGVGLALAAALKGYRCIFTMPDKMSDEKVRLLRAYGAEVVITPTAVPADHPDNYVMKAKSITKATPNAVLANQFYNDANPQAHYASTGPEIWEQTEGKVTHFVASAGTGGTLSGVGRFLKEQNPKIKVIAGDPEGSIYAEYAVTKEKGGGHPYKVEGVGGDKIPDTLHYDYIDEWHSIPDTDAFKMARRLAREEGLFVGGSAGLNVVTSLQVARNIEKGEDALIVTILPDTGERYLSKLFNDDWMRDNQLLDVKRVVVGNLLETKSSDAPHLVTVAPAATVRQALNLMGTYNVSQVPVIDGDECVGSLAESTLMTQAVADASSLTRAVRDVMDEPFPVVDVETPLDHISNLLSRDTPAALVRKDGTLHGIVTRYDVLHEVAGIR
ncbi:MAG: pyridoxal-phosphate dependent enzyme [Gemmatimonadota bacterium]|nr:pyridoxal-phosphate dependent enzyme [Gemmatimonadota bacterium]MDH5804402.1 pyridoxal-phosphate dependent enzyme [Gemmatimonadota bacterium]